MLRGAIAVGVALFGLVLPEAQAQERGPVAWSLTLENDKWGDGGDRHYTHGTRLTRRSDATPEWLRRAAAPLRCIACTAPRGFEIELGQEIYTPENTWTTALVADDRPYAGWAYGKLAVWGERDAAVGRRTAFNALALEVGVVGPAAFAQETQAVLHREKGVNVSQGWGNQLRNEAGLVLGYTRGLRKLLSSDDARVRHEIAPYFVSELGNVRANAGGGVRWRTGRNLETASVVAAPGWHTFVTAETRYVARNVLLDGNSSVDSHSVPKEPFVASIAAGLEYRGPRFSVGLKHERRSREFVGQQEPDVFGGVTFSFNP
jgi:hypothetical protein